MKTLQLLDMASNAITFVPPELSQLTALTTLILSENQLEVLPPAITALTGLQSLSLSGTAAPCWLQRTRSAAGADRRSLPLPRAVPCTAPSTSQQAPRAPARDRRAR